MHPVIKFLVSALTVVVAVVVVAAGLDDEEQRVAEPARRTQNPIKIPTLTMIVKITLTEVLHPRTGMIMKVPGMVMTILCLTSAKKEAQHHWAVTTTPIPKEEEARLSLMTIMTRLKTTIICSTNMTITPRNKSLSIEFEIAGIPKGRRKPTTRKWQGIEGRRPYFETASKRITWYIENPCCKCV